jgi:hypothetical protein
MTKLAIPLSILALALAGCAGTRSGPAMEAHAAPIVPQTTGYHSGTGVVQSTMLAPAPMGGATGGTATGASGHPAGTSATDRPEPPVGVPSNSGGRLNRLAIKMDGTGEVQYVDTDSSEFSKGTRVELTADGKIRKL